jgi:hypothetical protein
MMMEEVRIRPMCDVFPRLLSAVLVIVLLGLAPFASALEIHHALAAADDDGHQHSESDVCQWVQHHTGSLLAACQPSLVWFGPISDHDFLTLSVLISARLISVGPSRAPPFR